ncbi:hypothetical protein GYB29_03465 [bacterium]|nr:hypothetical protein [bacterium]
MVTITDYKSRTNEGGEEFFVLIVEGGIETIRSENGNLYFTSKKASVPSTYDAERCKMLIGHQLPGIVKKVKCEPYEYQTSENGESIMLDYKYTYECEPVSEEEHIFSEDEQLV